MTICSEVLQEHRKKCEKEGNYVEAEMAKNRIEELKLQEGQKQMENMMLKQQQDQLEIEKAHTKEYEQFQLQWEEKFKAKDEEHNQ